MSRDSMVTSLPSQGWSCQTLEEGVEMAAQKAGLSLNPQDFKQAGVALPLMGFLWGYGFIQTNSCMGDIHQLITQAKFKRPKLCMFDPAPILVENPSIKCNAFGR